MRFTSLGSGSSGNALVVEAGGTRVMLDCGFNLKETERRLARAGLAPADLAGVVVTHEHTDHIGGVARLARRHGLPVWLTWGTWRATETAFGAVRVELIDVNAPFRIGDLSLLPYTVPHDAREPVQFVFSDGRVRLGVLTDAGRPTPHIEQALRGCDGLVLEFNHDREMLMNGPYPAGLKRRVAGDFGHLDNGAAAMLLARLSHDRLQHIVAAHISQHNNTPELVRATLTAAVGADSAARITLADQAGGFDWIEI